MYCDRCGELFAGPPQARVVVQHGEFDVCHDCADGLFEWWDIEQETSSEMPTATVERG
jgi:ribosome-binding protein aMBF1 (putative translation factor)